MNLGIHGKILHKIAISCHRFLLVYVDLMAEKLIIFSQSFSFYYSRIVIDF